MGPGFSLYKSFLYVITYQGGEGGIQDPGFSSLNILTLSGRGGRTLDFSLYKSFLYVIREGRRAWKTLDFLPKHPAPFKGGGGWALDFPLYKSFLYIVRGGGGHERPWIFLLKHPSPFRDGVGDFCLYKSFLYVIREGEEVCEETTKTIVLDRPEENCSLDPQGTIYCFIVLRLVISFMYLRAILCIFQISVDFDYVPVGGRRGLEKGGGGC